MKNKLLYLLIFIVGGFASCDEDSTADYIFDKSVNERFSELYTEYNTVLQSPAQGWLGYYNPNGETGAYSILLKFNPNGSVIMHSDYKSGFANDTITYSITKKQDITLTFESWSVFHAIYETNNNNNGGEYVFNIASVSADEITLVSKTDNGYNGDDVTTLVLKPATIENWDLEPVIANVARLAGDANKSIFRNFEHEGEAFASFRYDDRNRTGVISYMNDGELINVITPVLINANGFQLMKEVSIEGKTMQNFVYDLDNDVFTNTDTSIKLSYDNAPAYTVDGVVDQLLSVNFKTITDYSANLEATILTIQDSVPNFKSFQLYSEWGYLLCYAPGTEGGNWSGFSKLSFTKTGEDQLTIGWEGYTYGSWWEKIYYNAGGQMILNFLLDENGLYVVSVSNSEFYLVSKSDPSKYCLVEL
ncbi:hypothetical protein BZG02_11470 [Labilibaculum filiforme]|uniref:DUF4302 domain-containing protein n=1 Tax=Labilibaculum filiforme TaxID=1940526 RepID=A0A2N3HXN0_9BACT|nr:DUF4302 domain-containing protein [Labilibaculum filiforme]PKQ62809.1 hypothetical protein BZG02_11470 [Labilibaculum filiforme]